ncbi:CBM96 family carbohydrate-binding protein [Flavobacterium algicola]|uniref:CBM96 family carbohydrate-binding protein n=1 Tax=Flavobacterium algicola TaxID=556529 RepID=UPI001EFC8E6B|nr:DNRLRE domain-containing protein [Flavobacterium algicola]MCG9793112.1 fasciclin domain-containing protein [Flavobacterium algicola]
MKKNKLTLYSAIGVLLTVAISMFSSCEIQENFDYQGSETGGNLGINAWEYIQKHDSLTSFKEAITLTGLQSLYETETDRTFIAPTNQAFKKYLQTNSYSNLSEVPVAILRNMLKYHVVKSRVSFDDPDLFANNNPIAYTAENGQTMFLSHSSNFTGYVNEGTSQQWPIVTSNLKATNGVIHVLYSTVFFSALSTVSSTPDPTIQYDTIYAAQDTYINGGSSSGKNFGNDKLLKIKNVTNNGDYDRKAYLLYDLKNFKKAGNIVDLKLEVAVSFTHGYGVDLNVFAIKDTLWTETGLTFNNAELPSTPKVSSIKTSKLTKFSISMIDYYKSLPKKQKISLVLDGQAGSNETDEFHSIQNTAGQLAPMLIARISSGTSVLTLDTNTGITLDQGQTFVFNKSTLEVGGATAADIKFTIMSLPQYGWLVKGASILKVGDKITQEDINVMNVIYINNGSGTQDKIVLSAEDIGGATLSNFDVSITLK